MEYKQISEDNLQMHINTACVKMKSHITDEASAISMPLLAEAKLDQLEAIFRCSLNQFKSTNLQSFDGFRENSGFACTRSTRHIHTAGNQLRQVIREKVADDL